MDKHLEYIASVISSNEDFNNSYRCDEINLETSFQDDLGFDSLKFMMFMNDLQNKYPKIDDLSFLKWAKVRDCILTLQGE